MQNNRNHNYLKERKTALITGSSTSQCESIKWLKNTITLKE